MMMRTNVAMCAVVLEVMGGILRFVNNIGNIRNQYTTPQSLAVRGKVVWGWDECGYTTVVYATDSR